MTKKPKANQCSYTNQDNIEQDSGCSYLSELKTKKIGKQAKQTQRRRDEALPKKGRPTIKEEKLIVKLDPTAKIQEKILQYLDNIGMKHGLVFRKEDRAILNKECKKSGSNFIWNQTHQWDKEKEKQKILTYSSSLIYSIRKYADYKKISEADLIEMFLCVGSIVADQCTFDIYTILAQILESIMAKEDKNDQIRRAEHIFNRRDFKFLSGKFPNKKIQNWLCIVEVSVRFEYFKKMFCQVFTQTVHLMENFSSFLQFLEQQKEIQNEFKKIIQECQKQRLKNGQ